MGNNELRARFRQFFLGLAIDTGLKKTDMTQVDNILADDEKKFFYQMNKHDQFHAYRVYQSLTHNISVYKLSEQEVNILIKAALLHDVGRNKNNSNLFKKVWAVIKMQFIRRLPNAQQINYKRQVFTTKKPNAIYVYLQHPQIAFEMLKKQTNLDEETLWLIKNHHNCNAKNSRLLKIIQKFDNQE